MALMPEEDEVFRSSEPTFNNTVITGDITDGWVMPVQGDSEWSGGSFMPNSEHNNHEGSNHPGIDIYAATGTSVVSPVQGTVMATGSTGVGGNWVQIRGDDGYVYYFAHMDQETHLEAGQAVFPGTAIGGVGNTGSASSTSPHLHFTMKTPSGDIVDPRPFLEGGTQVAGEVTGPVAMPSDGEFYSVDGQIYAMYQILGADGASHGIYYKLGTASTYEGTPTTLTASAWLNLADAATNGGTGDIFEGLAPGTSFKEIMDQTLMEMGIFGSDALADPDVLAVIGAYMGRPDMSTEELQSRLQQTDWYNTHTERQISWNDKSDAQQDLEISDAAAALVGIWFTYTGENINISDFDADGDGIVSRDELSAGNADLAKYAEDIASGVSTQPMVINNWVKSVAETIDESPWNQTIRNVEIKAGEHDMLIEQAAGQVMDLYRQYGIDMTWDEANSVGKDIVMNDLSIQDLTQQVDEQAMALYPSKPKGVTTMAWSQPYRQSMMSVLEIADPSLQDSVLTDALANGASIGEFRKTLKHDERWLKTKNANDEFNGVMTGLGNQMGF